MDSSGCPIWIDPDNAFKLVVKVRKYFADGDYGLVEMVDQEHDVWFDRNLQYSLGRFNDDMATKIIWGPSQTLSVWVVDTDSDSEWKIRRDEHFHQLIKERWAERVAVLVVDVVRKHGEGSNNGSSVRTSVSGVTNGECSGIHGSARGSGSVPENVEGTGDTCSSPPSHPSMPEDIAVEVDWANLIIQQEVEADGFATAAVDEDEVYEAMGFKAADERGEAATREAEVVPIPTLTAEMHRDMAEAAVPVDDNAEDEPMFDWDRDNPDMSVGTCYPSMHDFRLTKGSQQVIWKMG
ncbi:unnamed protein product [Urochloa decumbens]|uniref:Uncharacterized protein n=1 Tax=Urochloa decumbens TaxID=240449 RepID=A0ABC8WYJ4_9POAL